MKSLLTLTAAAMLLLAPALAFAGQKTTTTATAVGGYAGVVHNGFTAGNTFNAATVNGTRGSAVSVSTDLGVAAGRNASAAGGKASRSRAQLHAGVVIYLVIACALLTAYKLFIDR